MKHHYLEISYRKGKPLAAYLYLPRDKGAKSARTEKTAAPGLLVDFSIKGIPIGIEIVTPSTVTLEQINQVLTKLGLTQLGPEDLAPLRAA